MWKTTLLLLIAASTLPAQISYNDAHKQWFLRTASSTYVLGVNERNEIQNLYWGGPLVSESDFPTAHSTPERSSFDPSETRTREEYPGWGGTRFFDPALKITRAGGDRDLVLVYDNFRIGDEPRPGRKHSKGDDDILEIRLHDLKDSIYVSLFYRVYPSAGIIERHTVIRNGTSADLTLESAQSAVWYLPPGDGYRLTYVSGRWAAEDQLSREPIHPGMKVLESRRGNTSHNANPWFMIDDSHASEDRRTRLVRCPRLERQLASLRRTNTLQPGPRHRRLQHFRLRIHAQARRIPRNPALLRWLFRLRLRRRLPHPARLRAGRHLPRRRPLPPAPGPL